MTDHVPPSTTAATIAAGGNPPWEQTFTHPLYGELTFRSELPTSRASLAHRVALDTLLAEMPDASVARPATLVQAAALAGLSLVDPVTGEALMVRLPEIVSQRTEQESEHGTVVIKKWYDAEDDPVENFPVEVWTAFSGWRMATLGELDAVKGPFGETRGHESDTSSIVPTVSPSTTLA